MKETEIDYIYALVHYENKKKVIWYIGRTIEPTRRMWEHRYGAKTYKPGDEWKYEYASALDSLGVPWEMEILMECGPDTEFFEDYFVNKYRHEPLQNMKSGDHEPWMGRDYSSPHDFVRGRAKAIEDQRIQAQQARLQEQAARAERQERRVTDTRFPVLALFAWETPKEHQKRIESQGLAALRNGFSSGSRRK